MTKKPSAKKAFTPKQKADALKERKQDLKELKQEVVATKAKNNQDHFSFATAVVAGGGVANFIAFQGSGINDLAGKTLTTLTIGGLLYGLNKDFFFTSGVYKEMLRHINKELDKIEKNEFDPKDQIPNFKNLFDDCVEIRKDKVRQNKPLKSTYNVRAANAAVVIITSIATANLGYTIYEKGLSSKQEIKSDLKKFKGEEQIVSNPECLSPGP